MPRRCGVAAKNIYLSDARRNGFHVFVGVCATAAVVATHAQVSRKIAVRNGHVPAVRIVGSRAKYVARFVETHAPSVVGGACHPFDFGTVGSESKKCLAKFERVSVVFGFSVKTRIAHAAPNPVVEAVVQIARPRVGVARAEATEQDFLFVGFVVAVGVFQEKQVRGLAHNQATVGKHHARRNTQPVGKVREFIGFAVVVGIFTNQNVVAAARVFALIRVIFCNEYVKPPALVPTHGDGVLHVGFGGKQFEHKIGRNLNVLSRFFGREGILLQLRPRAFFVVGQFGFLVRKWLWLKCFQIFQRFFAHRPTNPFFE